MNTNSEHARLQDLADQHLRDNRRAVEPDDDEIVDGFIECFGGTRTQAIERLARVHFDVMREALP